MSKVQSTSELDYFHARNLPCSRIKSHNDPISDCRGDSTVKFPLWPALILHFALLIVAAAKFKSKFDGSTVVRQCWAL